MKNKNKKINKENHYICLGGLGGCRGVSKVPVACGAPNCAHYNHQLVKCTCSDGAHNNFERV